MQRVIPLLFGVLIFFSAHADETGRATMWRNDGVIFFWQTNLLFAGQGTCVVEFMFDAAALKEPIADLSLSVHVLGPKQEDLGVGSFMVKNPLGGASVARFQSGVFEGISGWEYPGREEGNPSPLCWPGITLKIESAVGKQAGKQVDLVLSKQLVFKEFQKVNVKLGK